MKPLAFLVLALALVSAPAALAHVDSLGQPDPFWQQVAAASGGRGSPVSPDGAAPPVENFVSSGGLSLLLLGLGVALALDVATTPSRSKAGRTAAGAIWTPATAPAVEVAAMTGDEAVRTVEVLPPSESGETRHVLRAMVVIVLAALLVSWLNASGRSNDAMPVHSDIRPPQSAAASYSAVH